MKTKTERMLCAAARAALLLIVAAMALITVALGTTTAGGAEAPDEPAVETMEPELLVVYAGAPESTEDAQQDIPDADENEKIVQALYDADYFWADIPLDAELQAYLRAACEESGVDYAAAVALCWGETRFQNISGDNGNSIGFLQVQPYWHQERMERLGVTDLWDPFGNFRVGLDYFAELLGKYPVEEAIVAYKSGSPSGNDAARKAAEETVAYMTALLAVHGGQGDQTKT